MEILSKTISHYPPEADQPLADKILEKLGEVRLSAGGGGRDLVPIQQAGRKIS